MNLFKKLVPAGTKGTKNINDNQKLDKEGQKEKPESKSKWL